MKFEIEVTTSYPHVEEFRVEMCRPGHLPWTVLYGRTEFRTTRVWGHMPRALMEQAMRFLETQRTGVHFVKLYEDDVPWGSVGYNFVAELLGVLKDPDKPVEAPEDEYDVPVEA